MKTAKQIVRKNQVNNAVKFYVWLIRLIIAVAAIFYAGSILFA